MAGLRGKVLLTVLVVLGTSSSAHAWWGWRAWGYGPGYYGYYGRAYYSAGYFAPAYYNPVSPVCSTMVPAGPRATAPAKKLAESVPGPTTKEPPAQSPMKKGPTVTEARSLNGAAASAGAGERCKVGFWNVTGRDVTLKVDGQPRLLPRDRAVTLDLGRSFSWQVDQDQAITEHVPVEQPFHEVILRQ
jgi:hypothetical protein